ncbi:pentatricopeptide repeat-containing protein At5g03800 [Cynara cardunculus var. scolymus]|uniref:Pentatricopeptide repeat-containing protein n=1 Tax=Cynara cardunculus var. scolymus TaxID=59895 RepID=A0A103YF58_CYNCS|nr:pentatricopeptide repeat-containing protein At5g03800 [Cynara cardunculus var. scolymus]KVI07959.1 Pentatricopeptide repeat-containing protein [Cynara cardunculus var. scolymus]
MAAVNLPSITTLISHSSSLLYPPKPPNSTPSVSFHKTPLPIFSNHTKTPQLHPSKNTKDYCNLLHLSVEHGYIELAMAVHASILKIQANSPYLSNALIVAYFKLGLTSHAYKVFNCLENPDVVTFTAMISWFARSNREIEAIKLFFEMRRLGIEPNEYSFVAILTACAWVLNLELGSQVHCLAIKMGFLGETYVSNALMGFYSKCGYLDCVLEVFDEMFQRDISSWNTVITALVKSSMYEKALQLFRGFLQTDEHRIDHFTLSTLLTACTEYAAFMEGRELHGHALKLGLENNLSVGNALIGFYTKFRSLKYVVGLFDRMAVKDVITWTQMISVYMESGLLEMAEKVFDKMPEKNCVSYNALLAGFCQNGVGSRALGMFCRMLEQGVELDDFSLTSIINACGLLRDKKTSEQIHGFILKFGFGSNDRIESALLDMCTKCGRMADAEKMFHSQSISHDNSIIWTSMICGYGRIGQPYEALSLFFKSQSENTITIDEIVSTTVLGICSTVGFDRVGEQIHCTALKSGLIDDIGVGNALIGMYSKCGNMMASIKIFNLMKKHDIVSWNSLMAGYVFHRQGDKALDLWAAMKEAKIQPDSITTLLIISAYTHTTLNMVNECHRFFHSMKTTYNIEPISDHYASLVGVFGRWGLLEQAEEIINKMPFEPDPFVWRALLDSCKTHMNTIIGERAAKEIIAKKPNDPSTYILISNLYSASGRWQCSETMREEMREKGFQKRPGKSWIIHENKVHSFYARDKSHPRSKDIYSGQDILVLECLKAGYMPDTSFVLHEVEEHHKRDFLYYHSAKLAVTYGLLTSRRGTPVRVMKNILLCGDCHTFFKYVSIVTKREIHIRDASGFHCFVNGECTCKGK